MKLSILILFVASTVLGAAVDYTAQGSWTGDCTTGSRQSPIDIVTASADQSKVDDLELKWDIGTWKGATTTIADANFKVNAPNSDEKVESKDVSGTDREWTAAQFHFHTPSEHTFDGVQYDAEVHFVNTREENGVTYYLVVGVMFDILDGQLGNNYFLEQLDL